MAEIIVVVYASLLAMLHPFKGLLRSFK